MTNEWFRNKAWSEAIENDFLQQQQHAAYGMRIESLKIQGGNWLGSRDEATQQAGIRLLEKSLADFANESYEVATVQEILGEYYYKKADFERAEIYLLPVIKFTKENQRVGVVRRADLILAEMILLRNLTTRLEEAYQLIHDFPNLGGTLPFEHDEHYYYALLAQVCYQLGKKEEAASCAQKAIAIAQTIEEFLLSKPSAAIEGYYNKLPSLAEIAG
jgi:tetratricopeptide (TPR) repeat protein